MRAGRHVAREISYASSAQSKSGRALIRVMEKATGRLRMIRRANGYEREVAEGRNFWQVMVERYGLSLEVVGGSLDNIPKTGPVVLIANHPYGILDGLMMGHILSEARGDFRILAHRVFRRAEDLDDYLAVTDAIAQTSMDTIVGKVDWSSGPVKNVSKTPLVAGQWQRGDDGALNLEITTNAHAPEIPTTSELKLL